MLPAYHYYNGLGTKSLQSQRQGQDGTFRVPWNEVHGSSLGSQVFAGAVDPDVHALDLVGRNTQLHVPVGK